MVDAGVMGHRLTLRALDQPGLGVGRGSQAGGSAKAVTEGSRKSARGGAQFPYGGRTEAGPQY